MKLLVIGGGGQLGSKIIQIAMVRAEVAATYLSRRPMLDDSHIFQVDKTNLQNIRALAQKLKPDVIVDTAALHNVDYCETHRQQADAVNVEGSRNVAMAAADIGAKVTFVSTDFVFDGSKSNYDEEDEAIPVSYYGQSKLNGELAVAEANSNSVIARPSVVYSYVDDTGTQSSSEKPLNFAMWLVQKLAKNEPVRIVSDQYASPTLADNLAEAILALAENEKTGIFHTAGATRLSRYGFALKLAESLGFNKQLISAVTTEDLHQLAKRPFDSSLSVAKLRRELNTQMGNIDQALKKFKRQYQGGQEN